MWRNAAPAHRALELVVVVPVRDEAVDLIKTLRSLALQRGLDGAPLDKSKFEVLLLANNCTDDSANLAREFAHLSANFALHVAEVALPPADAHIGHVRRLLMDEACCRLQKVNRLQGIVASTDGDTTADPYWLAHMREEFSLGVDAVGGRIVLDPRAQLDAATLRRHRCDEAYRLALSKLESLVDPDCADPWPRHHQHFGANLAVNREAYLKVGGVPAVRYLEDEALVTAFRRADMRVRHSPHVRVMTSPRYDGRVEVGLSWQLRQWQAKPAAVELMVEDPHWARLQFQARRCLREEWRRSGDARWKASAKALGRWLNVPEAWLTETATASKTFGALWQQVLERKHLQVPTPQLPIRRASEQLRALIRAHKETPLSASGARPAASAGSASLTARVERSHVQ